LGAPGSAENAGRVGVSVKAAPDPLLDTLLADRYHILAMIGQGGMGVVYKARQELLDRLVAVKMLRTQLITDESSVKRFRHEAKAASRLNHRNVITVYDFGVANSGEPYIVMEYLEGLSLADAIGKGRVLPVERALNIFDQVCDALEHAHSQGMIHRDLKPANIMLPSDRSGQTEIKVVDFGIAKLVTGTPSESQKLTQTGEIFGSPVYMSPEQCRGEELGPSSDIYAMGIVMYETLTGRVPFMGSNIVETITQHLCASPPPFSQALPGLPIPESVEAIVMKCLRKEPSVRYRSMAELKYDIIQQCGPDTWRRQGSRPTSEFVRPGGRASGELSAATGLPAGENQSRTPTGRPLSEFAPTGSRPSGEFNQGQRRTGAGRYPNLETGRQTGRSGRNPQSLESGSEQPREQNSIIFALAGLVALMVAVTGAIIWAATNGYFSKPQTATTAAPTAPRQPPAVAPVTATPASVKTAPAKPSSGKFQVTPLKQAPPKPVSVAKPPDSKPLGKRPARTSTVPARRTSEPVTTQPAEEPVVPTRHHYHGDDYSRWSDFRQLEHGQSKGSPSF
jgi:serine/threonine protein kinase